MVDLPSHRCSRRRRRGGLERFPSASPSRSSSHPAEPAKSWSSAPSRWQSAPRHRPAGAEAQGPRVFRHPFGAAPGPDHRQLGLSLEAFVRANVKPGATLITDGHAAYPGLSATTATIRALWSLAAGVVLPWSPAPSFLKRWALGTYHGLRRKHVDALSRSVRLSLQPPLFIGTARSKRCSGSPHTQARNLSRHHQPRRAPQGSLSPGPTA